MLESSWKFPKEIVHLRLFSPTVSQENTLWKLLTVTDKLSVVQILDMAFILHWKIDDVIILLIRTYFSDLVKTSTNCLSRDDVYLVWIINFKAKHDVFRHSREKCKHVGRKQSRLFHFTGDYLSGDRIIKVKEIWRCITHILCLHGAGWAFDFLNFLSTRVQKVSQIGPKCPRVF